VNEAVFLLLIFSSGLGLGLLMCRRRFRWKHRGYTMVVAYQAVARVRVTMGDEQTWCGPDVVLDLDDARKFQAQLSMAIHGVEAQYGRKGAS
jgi:transposase